MSDFLSLAGTFFLLWVFFFGGGEYITAHFNAWVISRRRRTLAREEHERRVELLRESKTSIDMLVVDKELATDFNKRLSAAIEKSEK